MRSLPARPWLPRRNQRHLAPSNSKRRLAPVVNPYIFAAEPGVPVPMANAGRAAVLVPYLNRIPAAGATSSAPELGRVASNVPVTWSLKTHQSGFNKDDRRTSVFLREKVIRRSLGARAGNSHYTDKGPRNHKSDDELPKGFINARSC